jgi:hypothetical protein
MNTLCVVPTAAPCGASLIGVTRTLGIATTACAGWIDGREWAGRVKKRKAQLPDADQPKARLLDDPFAHLTATQRFAQAVERRDALTREPQTPEQREGGAPTAGSPTVKAPHKIRSKAKKPR